MSERNFTEMTENEKEKAYKEAVGYLSSSLTNDELIEESLNTLLLLGDYKESAILYEKHKNRYERSREEQIALLKKRGVSRKIQGILIGLGCTLILAALCLLVYLLKLDIVR